LFSEAAKTKKQQNNFCYSLQKIPKETNIFQLYLYFSLKMGNFHKKEQDLRG